MSSKFDRIQKEIQNLQDGGRRRILQNRSTLENLVKNRVDISRLQPIEAKKQLKISTANPNKPITKKYLQIVTIRIVESTRGPSYLVKLLP